MNKLVIPASANWYESTILVCAPDKSIIYGARNDLVIIKPKPVDEPAEINTIYEAHKERINCVAISPSWSETDKFLASASEDYVVKLWNIETLKEKAAHVAHNKTNSDKIVGITFAGNDKIVSVSQNGYIVIWRISANTVTPLANLFNTKVNITSIASCPHASWLTAFGVNTGLIIIADLRKAGRVVHRLKGHDRTVVGLSWCPTPYNVYKLKTIKQISDNKISVIQSVENVETEREKGSFADSALCHNILDLVNQNVPDDGQSIAEMADRLEKISVQENLPHDVECNLDLFGAKSMELQKLLHSSQHSDEKGSEVDEDKENSAPVTKNAETSKEIAPIDKVVYKTVELVAEVKSVKKNNPWGNLTFACDLEDNDGSAEDPRKPEEIDEESLENKEEEIDFLLECQALKNKIVQGMTPEKTSSQETENETNVSCDSETLQEDTVSSNSVTVQGDEISEAVSCLENLELDKVSTVPKDFLLASSSRGGRSIIIWRAGGDGLIQDELFLKGAAQSKRRNSRNAAVNKSWISICWTRPLTLLSSSMSDELIMWTLPFNRKEEKKCLCLIHADHKRPVFQVATVPKLYPELDLEAWTEEPLPTAWTTGRDRWIFNTSLEKDRTLLAAYPTCGGQVFSMVSSPLDPNRLALSVGDQCIALWDLSRPHVQTISFTIYSQKLNGKIYDLAWHPTQENILAFGNADGRVGIIDTGNISKPPTFLSLHSTYSVYCLQWGPLSPGNIEEVGLYVSAGGKLFIYDTKKPFEKPKDIESKKGVYVNLFSWKTDYSMLAIGYKDGSVVLMDNELKKLTTLYGQQKAVQCLQWHPLSTVEDTDVSPYEDYLAVGTSDVEVFVYDCFKVLTKLKASSPSGDEATSTTEAEEEDDNGLTILVGHSKLIKSLAWSPHHGARLVSTGGDGVAQIWDVKNKMLLGTYLGYPSDVFQCALWSPLDADLIITGSKLANIHIWKVSEHPPRTDVQELVKKHKIKYLKAPKDETVSSSVQETCVKLDKPKRTVLMPRTCRAQGEMSNRRLQDCVKVYNDQHDAKYETVLENAIEDASSLEEWSNAVKLFGSRADVLEVVEAEQEGHCNRFDMEFMLDVMKGTSPEYIRKNLEKGNVNAMVVGVAASVSHALWLEACEAYAKKLAEMPKTALEAAMYFLACHKVDEAIGALIEATLYREALALAKVRFPDSDPILQEIMEKWAVNSLNTGSYELAAQNFLSLGKLEEAAKALLRRSNVETLQFAAFLAKQCNNLELVSGIESKIKIQSASHVDSVSNEGGSEPLNICSSRVEAILLKEFKGETSGRSDDAVGIANEASERFKTENDQDCNSECEDRLSLD